MLNYTSILNDNEINAISIKTHLGKKFIIKEFVIMHILNDLVDLKEDLILKGGTAVNKVYLREPRFSEDLDYDIFTNKKNISNKIKKRLEAQFKIEEHFMKKRLRLDCYYSTIGNNTDKIQIELNPIKKIKNTDIKLAHSMISPEKTIVNTYVLEELIQQKINALLNRIEGKDLYDLYYLLQSAGTKQIFLKNKEAIKKRIKIFYNKKIYTSISHYLIRDKRLQYKDMIKNFEELLDTL